MYKIMIVDDDSTSLAIGKALLENEFKLMLAYSGVQALGILKGKEMPDLILMDMVMPGINGIELLKTLKSSETLREIPVIFLTSESHVEEEVKSYLNGASDFMQKPISPEILRHKISQQLFFLNLKRENIKLKAVLKLMKDQFDLIFPDKELK